MTKFKVVDAIGPVAGGFPSPEAAEAWMKLCLETGLSRGDPAQMPYRVVEQAEGELPLSPPKAHPPNGPHPFVREVFRNPNPTEASSSPEIGPKAAADLFVQGAFRRSRGKGRKMKQLLICLLALLPTTGGGFSVDGTECHPNVPGVSRDTGEWSREFRKSLLRHIKLIRE